MSEKLYLNLKDTAAYFNFSIGAWRTYVRKFNVPCLRLERSWRFNIEKVTAYLENLNAGAPDERRAHGRAKGRSYKGNEFAKDIGLG